MGLETFLDQYLEGFERIILNKALSENWNPEELKAVKSRINQTLTRIALQFYPKDKEKN